MYQQQQGGYQQYPQQQQGQYVQNPQYGQQQPMMYEQQLIVIQQDPGQYNQNPYGQQYPQPYQQPGFIVQGLPVTDNVGGYTNQQERDDSNYLRSAENQPFPVPIKCPRCNKKGITHVIHQPGQGSWCCCIMIGLVFWPCCFLPFVVDDCQDKVHVCVHCKSNVGKKEFKICG